jgi:SAM-dependent methyltransferase
MGARFLPPAPQSLARGLEELLPALEAAQPLRPRHRNELPGLIAQLSECLTTDREGLPRDYLSRPALLSAYLYYFLPWNLYRQGRLMAGLDLQWKPGARIVDVGAGPLTFALALWLTRPDLRAIPLHYVAIDRGGAALDAGRRLWDAVAPGSPWRIELVARPAGARPLPEADLLVLANVLNEIHHPGGGDQAAEDDPTARLLERWRQSMAPGGRVLVIEPGTRPASRQLVSLRARAVDAHWRLLAPCPHHERCPQPGTGRHPWCHFGFDAAGAPGWLEDLSRRANLNKERASMSFLLIEPPVEEADGEAGADARGVATRGAGSERDVLVVSGAFPVSGDARGRYGCSARGLVLLEEAKPGPDPGPGPGDMVRVTWPDQPRRDGRSGASVVPLPERSGPARPGQALTGQARPGQARPGQSGKSRPASPPRKGPPRRGRP